MESCSGRTCVPGHLVSPCPCVSFSGKRKRLYHETFARSRSPVFSKNSHDPLLEIVRSSGSFQAVG
jgi:hypothetical protein